MTELSEADRDLLQRLEESLWRETSRFDRAYLDTVMAADFFEFGRSGNVYARDDVVSMPSGPINAVLPLADFQIRRLDQNLAQVTYNSTVTSSNGTVFRPRRSSIWSRTSDGWRMRFHQGTPIPDPD
ncbi:nuclear transport factor 2 family protein [Schlesneria paludicola]|uniref:nuclear transport factor 2 family protein n=1 Tax=Schlesneria paludicola TaxID=360056 RepID=UPI00029A25F9|nr:DUF4440 domain-containing protein [Schlesneria paludicola]